MGCLEELCMIGSSRTTYNVSGRIHPGCENNFLVRKRKGLSDANKGFGKGLQNKLNIGPDQHLGMNPQRAQLTCGSQQVPLQFSFSGL